MGPGCPSCTIWGKMCANTSYFWSQSRFILFWLYQDTESDYNKWKYLQNNIF